MDKEHLHTHSHEHNEEESPIKLIFKIALAAALVLTAHFIPMPYSLIVYVIAYVIVGYEVVINAVHSTFHGELFDENFLMALATIGAFAIGSYSEAVAVMIFYNVGELFQDLAVARSRKNIAQLMDIRPDFAVIVENDIETTVSPDAVSVGDIIRIKPGERVPLDCVVTHGASAVDTSALTGESVPLDALEGSLLSSGSVNLTGVLTCRVNNDFSQSTVQKILDLVSEAGDKKARAEKFITRFSKIYTPCVIFAAVLIAFVPPIFGGIFSEWFYRGLIFLVVSCPCALVISVPVGFLGGIGGAAKNGVLVKGGNVLDALSAPKAVVFDKTGTLTKGKFVLTEVMPAEGVSKNELMHAGAICERSSNHPIAVSVYAACKNSDNNEKVLKYEELAGYGVLSSAESGEYAAGNKKLMDKLSIALPDIQNSAATVLYIAQNGKYLGCLMVADEMKDGVKDAIQELRNLGVEKCYMLTGDNEAIAKEISAAAGLDGYKAGLLPQQKVEAFEEITNDIGTCVYAGDGINDAPLLARADVGIAMGGVGSDAAIEAADVVLMTDDISKIASAIRISRGAKRIVHENIGMALGIKLAVMIVAAFGAVPMWLAIFADVGVALLAVANSARAIRLK